MTDQSCSEGLHAIQGSNQDLCLQSSFHPEKIPAQLKAPPQLSDRQKGIVHVHTSPCHAGLPWAGAARGICLTARAAALHNFLGKREGRGALVVP